MAGDFEETPFQDGGVRVNSDLRRASAMGRLGWKIPDAGTLYASLRFIDAEKGIPFHTTEPVGFIKFARFPEWRQTTLALGYEHDFSRGRLRGQLYGHAFENTLEVFADPELETVRLESSFSDRVYGGYVQGDWTFGGGHRLGTALHLRQDRHLKTERYPDGSEDPSESYRAWTWSLSVEDRWRIDERNSLIGSLALEGLGVVHAESLREIGGNPALTDDPRPSETLLSPQIEYRRVLGLQLGCFDRTLPSRPIPDHAPALWNRSSKPGSRSPEDHRARPRGLVLALLGAESGGHGLLQPGCRPDHPRGSRLPIPEPGRGGDPGC